MHWREKGFCGSANTTPSIIILYHPRHVSLLYPLGVMTHDFVLQNLESQPSLSYVPDTKNHTFSS